MTTPGTSARVPTDDHLVDILRFVARTCLEVERGLRPPAHLASLMDPAERWLQPGRLGRFRAGPVRDDHIGPPEISRLTETHIIGTVVSRTEGDRWGALSLELRAHNGRWRIAGLQRLLAGAHYRTPSRTAGLDVPAHDFGAHVAEARRIAEAAHVATNRRLADLPPGSPGYRAAHDLSRYWQRTLRDLDHQLAEYKTRDQTAQHAERLLRR
ncbi:MAG: Rv3235 family protein [Actinomycetota bacterium]|nr:Rv3235 family protein [Actinomycetota bacterium]